MHLARTLLLDAPGGLLLGEPRSAGPEVPEKEIQPLSGVKDRTIRGFGPSAHTLLLCSSEERPSVLGAAGPFRTIRRVLRG